MPDCNLVVEGFVGEGPAISFATCIVDELKGFRMGPAHRGEYLFRKCLHYQG